MGQTLSSPDTKKHTSTGEDEQYVYAVSEMQGWRISMEDAHATILDLDEDGLSDKNAFFAVYDGHGGATVAQFAGRNVHRRLTIDKTYYEKHYNAALKRAFLGTDEDIRADPSFSHDPSGCTAVAALLTSDRKLYVANAGDSRSVISVKGEAKPLSYDHKPQNLTEVTRITAAGGYIENSRVNGNLSLSRAIGDFEYKKNYALSPELQIITADPDILMHELTDEDEFLVLACDGIWDCLSSQRVVDSIRRMIHHGMELSEICESLMEICLAPYCSSSVGCDNMTVIIIALLNGRSKEEWYTWVKDRVTQHYGYDTPVELPGGFLRDPTMDGDHDGRNENGDDGLEFEPFNVDDESDEETGPPSSLLRLAALGRTREELREFMTQHFEKGRRMNYGHMEAGIGSHMLERDGDMDMSEPDEDGTDVEGAVQRHLSKKEDKNLRQGEAPLPPSDAKSDQEQPQLTRLPPSGDAHSGAVKVEGLMDASENPFKTD